MKTNYLSLIFCFFIGSCGIMTVAEKGWIEGQKRNDWHSGTPQRRLASVYGADYNDRTGYVTLPNGRVLSYEDFQLEIKDIVARSGERDLQNELNAIERKREESNAQLGDGKSCFRKEIKNADVVTGVGDTLPEAKNNLGFKLPSIGILQRLDTTQRKSSNGTHYSESSFMAKSVKANLDYVITQNCFIDDKYAVSAFFPKKAVNYFSDVLLKNAVGEFATFEKKVQMCGEKMYSVIVSTSKLKYMELSTDKKFFDRGVYIYIACFWVDIEELGQPHYSEKWHNQNNLYLVKEEQSRYVTNHSDELQLEMIKNSMK